ncbi:hypothetical protein EVAR_55324_1 [Eumeta japonica]|uniref:Uncharacterized protein n=1 Tax=Eumeta variegata TaxID=151549 RepID=A0A4C1ZA90_EUMVA|nr:hypothetical protein EVAR_55324_1 [Eumeta japonica]
MCIRRFEPEAERARRARTRRAPVRVLIDFELSICEHERDNNRKLKTNAFAISVRADGYVENNIVRHRPYTVTVVPHQFFFTVRSASAAGRAGIVRARRARTIPGGVCGPRPETRPSLTCKNKQRSPAPLISRPAVR